MQTMRVVVQDREVTQDIEVAKSILRLGQGPVLALREGPRLV